MLVGPDTKRFEHGVGRAEYDLDRRDVGKDEAARAGPDERSHSDETLQHDTVDRRPDDCGVRKLWGECSVEYFDLYMRGRRSRLITKLAFLAGWLCLLLSARQS